MTKESLRASIEEYFGKIPDQRVRCICTRVCSANMSALRSHQKLSQTGRHNRDRHFGNSMWSGRMGSDRDLR